MHGLFQTSGWGMLIPTNPAERVSDERNPKKIATFNVNGLNDRLSVLLRWLAEATPDIVCLQELNASDDGFRFPQSAGPVTARSSMAELEWCGHPSPGSRSH